MIQIQATIKGFGGKACTLFSAYDELKKVLVLSVEGDYRTERRAGCMVLTNDPEISRNSLFADTDLMPAIAAFFALESSSASDGKSPRMVFADRAKRCNPQSAIERDGLDASGPCYRVSEGVTCGQIAALATCLYAIKAGTVERVLDMSGAFRTLVRGGILTI